MNRMSFSASLGVPSAWVARGLNAAARGDLAGHRVVPALAVEQRAVRLRRRHLVAGRLISAGYNRLATGGDLRPAARQCLAGPPAGVEPAVREADDAAAVLKDFRTFRRDPQQWGQVVLFLALLALYFSNIRRMSSPASSGRGRTG